MESIIWVGLDVHKSSTTVAVLDPESEHDVEVIRLGADLIWAILHQVPDPA